MSSSYIERVMIFIDGSNLFRCFKRIRPNVKYDVSKLVEVLSENKRLIRPYYFGSERVPPAKGQTAFHNQLQYEGIDVTIRGLKTRTKTQNCPYENNRECTLTTEIEKGIDVSLVTKMISLGFKNTYDTAILISGDADYVEAVQQIRDLGKRVEIVAFPETTSPSLRKVADKFIDLNDLVDRIRMQ